MVSATIEPGLLVMRWNSAFEYDGTMHVLTNELFSNGFRYMNWLIDVPVLLTQPLIGVGITGGRVPHKRWACFVAAGMLMIDQRANSVVIRNLIYSFTDIGSKAVHGILLAVIAQKMSAHPGFQPAVDAEAAFVDEHERTPRA